MKNKRRQIGISRKTANNLIYAVAILYTLMNVVVIVLTALDGIADREEVAHLVAQAIGMAGGLWLCFFIPKESRRAEAEWKTWEEELEAMPEED